MRCSHQHTKHDDFLLRQGKADDEGRDGFEAMAL
jgi:hypothetical protein